MGIMPISEKTAINASRDLVISIVGNIIGIIL
jgi:hypothetical protein